MDILPEKGERKKNNKQTKQNKTTQQPMSVTELLRIDKKGFVQGVCYFINNIPIFI
jgi:hypothetical protein